jgi:hypothetical protein
MAEPQGPEASQTQAATEPAVAPEEKGTPTLGGAVPPDLLRRKMALRRKRGGAQGRPDVAAGGLAGEPGPLPHRDKMEAGFGEGLGGVRAHTGPEAKAAADELGTEAFAVGQDVAFRDENPSEKVVAHEVAHTLQQRGGDEVKTFGGAHSDPLEHEADLASQVVTAGGQAHVTGTTSGTPVQGFESLGALATQFKDGAQILWELSRLSDFHLFSGTFEGDLDVGKAAYYAQLIYHGGILAMLQFDAASRGSNMVHLSLNLYKKTFAISAKQLHLAGFVSPTFIAKGCTLTEVAANGNEGAATLSVGGASMESAVFIRDKERIEAGSVALLGVSADAAYKGGAGGKSLAANLAFNEAKISGLRYPGMPATDLDVKQAGLSLDALWTTLGPSSSSSGPLPEGGDILPKDSRISVELTGLQAKAAVDADKGAASGEGGFGHFGVTLTGADGSELAAIAIDGFHAEGGANGGNGSIDKLVVRGAPGMVKGLLAAPQVKANPQVAQAFDVIKSAGIEPAVGGSLTIEHVGLTVGKDGAATAKGNLAATLVVPDLGSLELALDGFSANLAGASLAASFDKFTAKLLDKAGKELAFVELDGAAGTADIKGGKNATGSAKNFVVRGDLSGLVKAAEGEIQKLPPQVASALEAVKKLGVSGQLSGGLKGSATDGSTQVAGDLNVKLDVGAIGSATLAVKGFAADAQGSAAGGSFTHLEARLTSKNREAAFFSIDGASGGEKGKALDFKSKKVEVRGDAASLGALLGAIEKQAPSLPPAVKSACQAAKSYALAASGDATLSNLEVSDDGAGGQTVHADLGAVVKVAGVGELDVAVAGFQAHAQKSGAKQVAFDKLNVTLKNTQGAEAAFFAAAGKAQAGADPKNFGFQASKIEARGDAANLDTLFAAANANIKMLPAEVREAFATVHEFGLDGKGSVTLDNVAVSGDKDGTRVKADMNAGFELNGVGKVAIVVRGFSGSATTTSKEAQFDAFEASLTDVKGALIAHLAVLGSKEHAGTTESGGKDLAFHAQKVDASGSAKDLGALFGAVEQHVKALPPQVLAAFNAVKEYGAQFPAVADIDMTDVDLGSKDGHIQAQGDLSAAVEVPDVGKLEARLKGAHGADHPGFDSLDLKLDDPTGGEAATLHVGGVTVGADGKSAQIGSIQAHGDGARLHAVLGPKVQALLPPQMANAISQLDGDRLTLALGNLKVEQGSDGQIAAGADSIVVGGAVNFVDPQGGSYSCPDAMLSVSGAKVQLGADRKPRQIDAASLSATGAFSGKNASGAVSGIASLSTGTVKVVMGPGGVPLSVVANDIKASGDIQASQASQGPKAQQTKQQQIAGLKGNEPTAEAAAQTVRSADIHTHTPMFPGKYGRGLKKVGVMSGTTMNVDVAVRGGALAAGTDVKFTPPLDLPAWLALKGVNLEVKGKEGVLKTDLKGFFDFNLSKYVSGKGTMSLNLTTLVHQAIDTFSKAIAETKEPSAKDQKDDAEWLAEEHADWQQKAQSDAEDARGESAAEQKKAADKDAGEEPRSANAADLGTKGMDVANTSGTADLEIVPPASGTSVDGAALPAGQDIHVHGQSPGGGAVQLTVDQAVVQAGGGQATVNGLNTGEIDVQGSGGAGKISFKSFSIKQLRWDALGKKS